VTVLTVEVPIRRGLAVFSDIPGFRAALWKYRSCLRIGWECSVEPGALNPDSSALVINVKQWIHWADIVLDTVERNKAYFVNKEKSQWNIGGVI